MDPQATLVELLDKLDDVAVGIEVSDELRSTIIEQLRALADDYYD